MNSKDFVIINIGRNTSDGPMPKAEWLDFQSMLKALIIGESIGYAQGSSQYMGTKEGFATFHYLVDDTAHEQNRGILSRLARFHGQDSIAYVISQDDSLVYAAKPLDVYL